MTTNQKSSVYLENFIFRTQIESNQCMNAKVLFQKKPRANDYGDMRKTRKLNSRIQFTVVCVAHSMNTCIGEMQNGACSSETLAVNTSVYIKLICLFTIQYSLYLNSYIYRTPAHG